MKVVHAIWERRNLGVDAYEISIESADFEDIARIADEIGSKKYAGKYVVVKMPVGNPALMHTLENIGFRFLEAQLRIACDMSSFRVPTSLTRFENFLQGETAGQGSNLWSLVADKIDESMFISDRIYFDDAFPKGSSAKRYRNWVMDMMNDNSKSLVVFKRNGSDSIVAFDVISSDENCMTAWIGGVFPGQIMMGLPHILSLLKHIKKTGASYYHTEISSNNTPMLKVYAQLGAYVCDVRYVFGRH